MIVLGNKGVPHSAPENTLMGFCIAKSTGAGILVDVRVTRDGVPVCIRDASLDRTTNGKGLVRSFTLDEIKTLDAGGWFHEQFAMERIPTLEEVLSIVTDAPICVRVRCPGTESLVVAAIQKTKSVENTFVVDCPDSYDFPRRILEASTQVQALATCTTAGDFGALKLAKASSVVGVWCELGDGAWVTEALLNDILEHGYKMFLDTGPQKKLTSIPDMPFDGICTEHPSDLLIKLGVPIPEA